MKKTPMPNPAEGLFENIPKINEQFQRLDCSIRHFRKSKFFPEVTKARLIQERPHCSLCGSCAAARG